MTISSSLLHLEHLACPGMGPTLCCVHNTGVSRTPPRKTNKFKRLPPKKSSLLRLVGNLKSSTDNYGTSVAFASLADPRSLFPRNMMVDVTYCDQVQLTGGSSTGLTGSAVTYNLNDIYAPGGNTNHQPRFRDQVASMYSYYRVHEVAIRLSFFGTSVNTNVVAACIQSSLDTYSFASKSPYVVREARNAWCQVTSTTRQPIVLTKSFKIWEIEGLPREEWVGNGSFGAQLGSSPATVPKLNVFLADIAAGASPSCYMLADFIFRVEMFGSITQSTS